MKTNGLNPMNVEKALETLYEASSIDTNGDVIASYYVLKEFIGIIKKEAGIDNVPALLRKRDDWK